MRPFATDPAPGWTLAAVSWCRADAGATAGAWLRRAGLGILLLLMHLPAAAATATTPAGPVIGPIACRCHGSGPGLTSWFDGVPPLEATAAWSVGGWFRPERPLGAYTMLGGFGDGVDVTGAERYFVACPEGVRFWTSGADLPAGPALDLQWHHLFATCDGIAVRIYRDGVLVDQPHRMALTRAAALVKLGPPSPWLADASYAGSVAGFVVYDRCLDAPSVAAVAAAAGHDLPAGAWQSAPDGPTPDVVVVAPVRGQRGLQAPQDAATIPAALPPGSTLPPVGQRTDRSAGAVSVDADGDLHLGGPWLMADGTALRSDAATLSHPEYDASAWYPATVPGTALTTLVDQGVYPDPLHGRNNLLIPDALARHNWWYRLAFRLPAPLPSGPAWLIFNGINYHAQVWLNGIDLGSVTGAFIRGRFDASAALRSDRANILLVHVWPPPHPGLGHEQSLLAGPGPNGGDMTFDGPTFFCTEGWDWIPAIRDRCAGIWQDVVLHHQGAIGLGDPRVVTTLPRLPDLSRADLRIEVRVRNAEARAEQATIEGRIGTISYRQTVDLGPGEERLVVADPGTIPALAIDHPRLWWPNGYGEPALQDLDLTVSDASGAVSDRRHVRFGIRTLDYRFDPHLVVIVNGQRILCNGGNWGMDDALKRVSRARLEPYVRMHRDAHLTMIRNWCGQSTEEAFYQLCDAYGLMVWNEFWMTTADYNVDPLDGQLMLDNVRDTVRRFRNHPCIVLWCGRNEGVPPDRINDGLGRILASEDGTRLYQPSSRNLHLLTSGPWSYLQPQRYAGERARGFSSELGLHSIPLLDAMQRMLDPTDRWPPDDAWAYHDLHVSGNGDAHDYLDAIAEYGQPTGLADFCRKAQMVNYVNHRALFEAWNTYLWKPCSGLLLWMSHPSWPSTVWQLYAQDYQANASLFGVQKACEPLHVQLDEPSAVVGVINHGAQALTGLTVDATILALDGSVLSRSHASCTAPADAQTNALTFNWPCRIDSPVTFLALTLRDATGAVRSDNFYWHPDAGQDLHCLDRLPPVTLTAHATALPGTPSEGQVRLDLTDPGPTVAVLVHAELRDAVDGSPILPAYPSEDDTSFVPGQSRTITIAYPRASAPRGVALHVQGWNVPDRDLRW